MRPRNLRLQGFGCFRTAVEINFCGLDVFVISGPTGAGKTTLIDAMCYALYGKVPRETRVMDLISHGASEMSVQLEFDAAGRTFRVHRSVNVRRTTSRKTGAEKVSRDVSPVQFEELIEGEWEPLHDRVADVDGAIEECVGLDFASFTKCVLLPQGRFAEFLTGKAEERRRILVELLDIGIYTRIMSAANQRATRLNVQIDERERQLREDFAGATEEALAAIRDELAAARPARDQARLRRDATQHASELASNAAQAVKREHERKQQQSTKDAELTAARDAAKDGERKLAELTAAVAEAEAELKRSPYDAELYAALINARSCADQLGRATEALAKVEAAAKDRSSLDSALAEHEQAAAAHAEAQRALAEAEAVLDAARRDDAAAHVRSGLKPGDPCPVCGGVVGKLPKSEKSRVGAAEKTLQAAKSAEQKAAKRASDAAAAVAREQHAFEQAARRVEDARAEVTRAEQAMRASLPKGVPAEAASIAARLAEQDAARKAHDQLAATLEQARRALHAQQTEMATSGQRIAALEAEMNALAAEIADARAEIDCAIAELREIATRWQWGDVMERIDAKQSPVDMLTSMLRDANDEAERLVQRVATLESDEQRIAKAIARAAELRDELESIRRQWQTCKDLGVLLRADNFQEFVIVEAMQALAESATEHLRALYDRFAIGVDGSEFVVVDHWHADQVRPAKTLSGGETFVASLALALALSERLPELRSAAAARLESLFLDEGFGTLDAETLETVIEALEGLRSAERMVGVITHVPELTQRIENRILVRKSPAGSSVELEGAFA